jgi:thiamine biosynthesis lipoprotein
MNRKFYKPLLFAIIAFIAGSCAAPPEFLTFRGFAQGTTYSVIYEDVAGIDNQAMRDTVEAVLREFDMSMSFYVDSSIISRINRNEYAEPDKYFVEIFNISKEVWELTDGAFDITVGPLVNAYGFGRDTLPTFSEAVRDSLMNLVGMEKVDLVDGLLVKKDPGITLDFNAIAQGYSVDVVSDLLESMGIKNYLVEIGGEVKAGGTKYGQYWRVGVDKPEDGNDTPGAELQAIIRMKNVSLNTSGNYRSFYVDNGVKYSHTIDPKTGDPARNTLLSATIVAPECAWADAIATGCMVMGTEKAIELINSRKELEGFLVYSDESGNYRTWISKGLEKLVDETPNF